MVFPTVANVVGNRCLLGYVVHDKFLRAVPSYHTCFNNGQKHDTIFFFLKFYKMIYVFFL